ncbi:MAG: glycosyltransferase family 2 protein [Syntrophorhabdales bacterium]|jgi:glycosyltransferase involved in cell wall biosynthesis
MKLSVCMATYNGERFVAEQLASIMPQLDEGDELVISDDSSTDRTCDIIGRFQDPRIRLIRGNTFYNPIYNIENAIARAGGEIIVLSDQDDVWLETKLSVVRRWFSARGPGINTLVLDGCMIDEGGRILHDSLFETLGMRKGLFRNLYRNTYMGCCMAFSRDLLRVALPFPPNIPMHDSWLGMLSELYGTVEFVAEKTIRYRRHASNRSFRRFTVGQQVKWRFFLAYHVLRRIASHPAGLIVRSSRPTPSGRSPAP